MADSDTTRRSAADNVGRQLARRHMIKTVNYILYRDRSRAGRVHEDIETLDVASIATGRIIDDSVVGGQCACVAKRSDEESVVFTAPVVHVFNSGREVARIKPLMPHLTLIESISRVFRHAVYRILSVRQAMHRSWIVKGVGYDSIRVVAGSVPPSSNYLVVVAMMYMGLPGFGSNYDYETMRQEATHSLLCTVACAKRITGSRPVVLMFTPYASLLVDYVKGKAMIKGTTKRSPRIPVVVLDIDAMIDELPYMLKMHFER